MNESILSAGIVSVLEAILASSVYSTDAFTTHVLCLFSLICVRLIAQTLHLPTFLSFIVPYAFAIRNSLKHEMK